MPDEPDADLISESWQAEPTTGSDDAPGQPSGYSCPQCHGVLWEIDDGDPPSFRCRTGHRLSMASLVEQKDGEAEDALYAAMRALEEKASARRRVGERLRSRGSNTLAAQSLDAADATSRQAEVVRGLLEELSSLGEQAPPER